MQFLTKTLLSILVLTLLLWAANKASANLIANSDIASQLPTIIAQNERPFNGIIMVKRNDEPLFTYISGDDVKLRSSFIIASLSKQVTATLVLKAVDDGKLELASSANRYLPISQSKDATIPDSVTISQLLSNTSGLIAPGKPPLFEPGSQFKYSNYGYTLLGEILENVYQQPITTQINALNEQAALGGLTAQLGKTSTIRKHYSQLLLGRAETIHQQDDNTFSSYANADVEITSQLIPAGGMMASADAYSHFQYALFSGQLISEKSLKAMTTSHSIRTHRWGEIGYGYGTQLDEYKGITEYSHSGYLPGYVSLALYYPQSNVNVVILENTSWDLHDTQRTFGLHDKLSESIRSKLVILEDRPVAKLYQAGKEAITATLIAAK